MRQTSRAVALLLVLESAQATAVAITSPSQQALTPFTTALPADNNNALIDRKSSYVTQLITNQTWAGSLVLSKSYLGSSAANAAAITKNVSSSCMLCLNSSAVWCSQTYNYNVSTGSAVVTQSGLNTAASNYSQNVLVSGTISAGVYDKGSCCELATVFTTRVGTIGVALSVFPAVATGTASETTGQTMNLGSCVANKVGSDTTYTSTTKFGTALWDDGTDAYTSWWCSNGLYKQVTASSTTTQNLTTLIPTNENKRKELAQVACPQVETFCTADVYTALDSSTLTKDINIPKATVLPIDQKCTWVASAVAYAPTFLVNAGTDALGLATDNWQLHHMEYTVSQSSYSASQGSLTANVSTAGYNVAAASAVIGTFVPRFDMGADAFSTLRTWYGQGYLVSGTSVVGSGALTNEKNNWYAPYQNSAGQLAGLSAIKGQYYGNVANFPSSVISDATPTATSSYGKSNSTLFDVRVVRYFPAQVAQMSHATGTALSTLYAGKLTSYNTAKATWDAYVAILAKNAKTDAFAAAFSPPKAPTVPPLPNMPWTPASYTGYLKQTPAQAKIQLTNTGAALLSAAQPTNQQIWYSLTAAQSIGGWGSFTAQMIRYRAGWGKSFGTIGYSGDATSNIAMSQVWNYKWMCAAANTASTPSAACDATYTTAAVDSLVATPGSTAANVASSGVMFVVAITLWSNGNINSGTQTDFDWLNKQSLKLTWTASAWASTLQGLSTIAAPTAATAASSLTGLAGAQALAASTAAALAAAALY